MWLVICNKTKENFSWEPEKINIKFQKMTCYAWNLTIIFSDSHGEYLQSTVTNLTIIGLDGWEGRWVVEKLDFTHFIIYYCYYFQQFYCTCVLMLPPSFLGYRTILAIAGEDFSVIAADTRLSQGFSIHTRDSPKTYKLWVKRFKSLFELHAQFYWK